jgi:hypothetical protein
MSIEYLIHFYVGATHTLKTGWILIPNLKFLFTEIDTELEPSPSTKPPKI